MSLFMSLYSMMTPLSTVSLSILNILEGSATKGNFTEGVSRLKDVGCMWVFLTKSRFVYGYLYPVTRKDTATL